MKRNHPRYALSQRLFPLIMLVACSALTIGGCGNSQEPPARADTTPQYSISGNVMNLLEEGHAILSRGTAVLGGSEEIAARKSMAGSSGCRANSARAAQSGWRS